MKKTAWMAFLFSAFVCGSGYAAADINLKYIPKKGYMSEKYAANWTQALLTGNGIMGAMEMGRPFNDTIIINHALLYRPQTAPKTPVSQGKHLDEIRKIMLGGDFQKAADYIVNLSFNEGYGAKIWTDSYIPAFDIFIAQKDNKYQAGRFARTVDFETGIAESKWTDGNAYFSRQTFVSRKDNVVVTRLTSSKDSLINCSISLRERVNKEWWGGIDPRPSKETHGVRIGASDGYLTYESIFDHQIPGLIKGYQGVSRIINHGGKMTCLHGRATITGANEVLILTRVEPDFKDTIADFTPIISELGKLSDNFDELLDAHVKIHKELFDRVSIDLGGNSETSTLSTEKMLNKAYSGVFDLALVEKQFYAARYHLISCIGINPPNLQGIWGGTTSAPWSGDFTTNGNLPVAVSSLLSANLPELMLPTFNMLEGHMKDFQTNAKVLFNSDGIHVPSRLSSHGLNNHFDGTWPMTFWTAGAAWYAMYYYDYYLYTGDKEFLRNRAMPFMEKAAKFYEDFLIKGTNGKYMFIPSYSPENNPSNNSSQACINATMDVMAANQLLTNCIAASDTLGINADKVAKWKQMLADMPPYEVNKDGVLREWMWPGIEENQAHRHVSHLYGLFDMMDPIIKNDTALQTACRNVIEQRMKIRRQDNGGEMVFGLVQLGNAASNLHEAETSYDILGWLSEKYWNTNLFTYHNPGDLFNCDLTGGFQQFVIKMLAYSEPGEVYLLPALPRKLPKGKISGLLLRGDIKLAQLSWDSNDVKAELQSDTAQTIKVFMQNDISSFEVTGATASKISDKVLQLTLTKGVPANIHIVMAVSGLITFDPTEKIHDATLTYDINVPISDTDYQCMSFKPNMVPAYHAFLLQPYDLTDNLGTCTSTKNVKFCNINADGSVYDGYTTNTSDTNWGGWFDIDGNVCKWGDKSYAFCDFSTTDMSFTLGRYPKRAVAGDKMTIRQAFIYKNNARVTFLMNLNFVAADQKAEITNTEITTGPTGIFVPTSTVDSKAVYDLQGRMVDKTGKAKLRKGVYISNRHIFVK
jgi:alpha-L-fucosidase 2